MLVISILSTLIIALPITANATTSGTCGENLTWTLDDAGTLTISGTGDMYNKSHYANYPKPPWYSSHSLIKNIVIINGVTSIGNAAFCYCENLTNIEIASSVTSIGEYAFIDCMSLADIEIPSSVTSIGEDCFTLCPSLTNINVDENNNFYSSQNGVLFNEAMTQLVQYPIGNTRTDYTLPNSVTNIGYGAFRSCTNLINVKIPNGVISISEDAFRYCRGLTSITIPDGVKSIGAYAFEECNSLASVTIPDSVERIEEFSFSHCSSLTNITIPQNVTWIGGGAFAGCKMLKTIYFYAPSCEGGGWWSDNVGNTYSSIFGGCTNLSNVVFGEDVRHIPSYFLSGSGILEIELPATIQSIGMHAFSQTGISTINLPEGLLTISNNAFTGCKNLNDIVIPSTVTFIGEYAFSGCSLLTEITIPLNVEEVKRGAFNSCTNLKTLNLEAENARFGRYREYGYTFDSYASVFSGCSLLTNVNIGSSVKSIPNYFLYKCSYIQNIIIPDNVTSIGANAFNGCTRLSYIYIPENVTNISSSAFYGCNFKSAGPASGVYDYEFEWDESIPKYAFAGCDDITNVKIPNSITEIGSYAFSGCDSLSSIFLSESIKSIGSYAFRDCSSLSNIEIPQGITRLENGTFDGCSNLISISFSNTVKGIGNYAFDGCTKLADVYYWGSQNEWNKISKGSYNTSLTKATIHFNPDRNNDNNYNEISANTQHNLPNEINQNIKINKTGKAYAYFILQDQDGNIYKNKSYSYKIKGNGNTVYIGQTDVNGIAAVSTSVLNSYISSGTTVKTITVEFTNDDLLQKTFTFDVTLAPPSYKQSWTGKVELGANAGISLGVAGSVGTLKGEAELASVGASGKTAKTISVEDIYKDGARDLHLTSSTDQSIAAKAKIGLYAGIGNSSLNQELSLGKVEGEVSTGYTLGKGFYIENYNPNDPYQRMNIELFLLDTAMGLDGSNVIPRILLNYWLEQNGLPTSNEEKSDVTLLFKAGASLPTIQLGPISTSVGGMNTDALYQFSKSKDHEDKTTTSTKVKVTADKKLFNTSYKGTAGESDVSIKAGSAVYTDRFINNSIQFSATTADEGVEKISFKTAEDSDISSVFTEKTSTEYFKNISYSGNAAKNLVNKNSFMKTIANGEFSFFGISSAQSVADDMTAGTYTADFSREKEYAEEFGQKFSFGLGDNLGIDFGLTGTHKYSYTAETGIIENGYEYIKTSNTIDEEIKNNGKDINEILDEIMDGIKADFSYAINEITGSVKDGLEWMKAKIEGAVDWTVKLTSFNTNRVRLRSFSIMSVAEETETIEDASVATTIGEPYIVDVTDSNGNEIKDFGSNTLDLSLYFDSNDFAVAEVGYTQEMMDKLKIYYWDSEKGVYVCVGGTLDAENSCITTKISKPGQYILAVDNCAPAITEFVVSSSSATPTISAIVADMSGIATFTFTLDGEEVVTIDNFHEYYNRSASAFTYTVTEPLSEGEHTASIIASDSSGNVMSAPEEIVFTVDSALPEITSVNVPELSTTQKLLVTATAEDDNLSSLIASVEYDGNTYSYPMTEIDGIWQVEINEMPKFARLNVSISAYDDAGNCTTSEQYEVILAAKYTEEVYIGVLDYEDKNVEVLINNTSNEDVEALLIVNGYDENNNLVETKSSEVSVATGYLLTDVLLDNSCYKVRAELVHKDDNTSYICTGFSAYLNESKAATDKSYVVTLVDENTTSQMTYDEFNIYVPETKNGYVFMGWYLDSSFEPSMKIDKLTTDYGESTTLYGWWLKESELIDANITSSYESDKLSVNLDFELAATDGIAYIEIFDYDEQGELKINQTITKNISKDLEELNFDIPFAGDNQTHLLRVSFYDNIDTKKTIGATLETEFYAERKVYETEGFCYYLTDDGEAELIDYQYSDYELWLPISLDGYPVTKIADEAFMNSSFESVIIPDTISRIGANVFGGYSYLETVKYIGTEEQWNAISIDENNETLNSAEKIFEYSEGIVYGGFNNIEFTGSSVDGTIAFDYVYRDCVAIIEIRNYDNEIKTSIQIEVPKTTEEVDFSIPFEADDEEYEIYVSFVKNSSDKVEVGDGDYNYFCAERERYTDGDFTYVLIGEHAEVVGYSGDNTEVVIPNTLGEYAVAGIGKYALSDSSIETIEFPETLTYIEEGAFAGTLISSISIPASVISIGDFAFDYCYNLASITVDENNKNYCSDDGNLYSKDKTELVRYAIGKTETTWTIPNAVTTIKNGAISDSEYLTDVIIPNGVTHIGRYAFGWGAWETLTIPASVVNISSGAFVSCENLKEINVDSNNLNYCSDNGVLFDKNKTVLIQYPIEKTENSYKVPKGVTVISSESFAGSILQSILFPQSLETVEKQAFENCQDLNLILYDGTREEFWNIDFARGNDVIESVEIIYEYSSILVSGRFYNVEFTGSSVNILLNFNYVYENCIAIIEIIDRYGETEETLEIAIPVGTEEKEFSIPFAADDEEHEIYVSFVNNTTEKIEVGEGDWDYFYAEKARYTDGDWTYALVGENAEVLHYSGENTELVIPDTLGGYSVTRVGNRAFEYSNLTAISIPSTVTYIGEYAFCDNEITEITLSENLTHIGRGAFAGTALTSIFIPASVEEIEKFAFDYCYNLASITVDENNENYCSDDGNLYSKDKTELVRYALGKTATSWTIPNTVTTVKAGALTDSEYLTSVTIPNSVTLIEEYAFAYGLWQTLTIPASVTNIDNAAFIFCKNLTEINVDSNNDNYCSDNGVLFSKDKTILLQYPTGKTNTFYKLPDSVNTISQESFVGCSLQTIVLPTSLVTVEIWAFEECRNLNTVLYEGTEDEYWEIDFTRGNDVLQNANITFGYDGMPASIKSAYCWYDNNKVTAKIKFNYIEQAGTLYLAIYDEGRLVTLQDKPVAIDEIENTIEIIDVDEKYKDYDVKVLYWDGNTSLKPLAKFVETEIVEAILVDDVLESEHPYADDMDETTTYVYEGECVSIDVTFSDDTETESGWDYIYIYDANGNQIGKYSGTELAGQTIPVPGNTVKIRLTSDGSYTEYGYRTESIVVNK